MLASNQLRDLEQATPTSSLSFLISEVLANSQLRDLEQATPTSSLSFLISEVGLRPTPHHCYEHKISYHMLRSPNQTHDKCSRNAYLCIRRFIHSFINEIEIREQKGIWAYAGAYTVQLLRTRIEE